MGIKDKAKAAAVTGLIMGLGATAPHNRDTVPLVSRGKTIAQVEAAEKAARMRTQTRDAGVRKGGSSGKKYGTGGASAQHGPPQRLGPGVDGRCARDELVVRRLSSSVTLCPYSHCVSIAVLSGLCWPQRFGK